MLLRICNNFLEQNCLDKPVFNNVSRLNYSSLMKNAVTKKIKHFPQLLALDPQVALKPRWYFFLFWSFVTTKLDIYVYEYKDDYICKGVFQAICLVTIIIWLNFLLEINPFISPCSRYLLVPVSIFHAFTSLCTHLRKFLWCKSDNWFLSVTLYWIYNYKCQTKIFRMAKRYLVVMIMLPYSWNTAAFLCWRLKCKYVFISLF